MEKVYISKVLKGKEPIHSIGMLDVSSKHLYIPCVSKKGLAFIDVVECDYVDKIDNGYKCTVIVVTPEGNHYVNTYFARNLTKEGGDK